jgi:hypothetical protein
MRCSSRHETWRCVNDRTSRWGGRSVMLGAHAEVALPASAMLSETS